MSLRSIILLRFFHEKKTFLKTRAGFNLINVISLSFDRSTQSKKLPIYPTDLQTFPTEMFLRSDDYLFDQRCFNRRNF